VSERFQGLMKIAHKLNQLREDANARVHYELMSDGLVWSDELPPWSELETGESHCLRAVWRFRTSLIEEKPDERYRANWEKAQELFPQWPGFLPERHLPKWRELFREQRDKLVTAWEDLDAKFESQQARAASGSAAT
jgi:hypothetical protein